jgi:hypothetical protein
VVFGPLAIDIQPGYGPCETFKSGTIICGSTPKLPTVIHELFHVFDNRYQELSREDDHLCGGANEGTGGVPGCLASNYFPPEWVDNLGYQTGGYMCASVQCMAHPPTYPGYNFLEAFANLGQNLVLDYANLDPAHYGLRENEFGAALGTWMDDHMPIFLEWMGFW